MVCIRMQWYGPVMAGNDRAVESGDKHAMNAKSSDVVSAESRLIRYEDLVPCQLAFIDCKLPGSDRKLNYSIIGPGVTQSTEQVVNLAEPHGFADRTSTRLNSSP